MDKFTPYENTYVGPQIATEENKHAITEKVLDKIEADPRFSPEVIKVVEKADDRTVITYTVTIDNEKETVTAVISVITRTGAITIVEWISVPKIKPAVPVTITK